MRKASAIVAETLDVLEDSVRPGMTTDDLDAIANREILKRGGKPAFIGYRGYPKTLCASVNEEVVHGIPNGKKVLREGDIVGCDLGAIVGGWFGDSARTFAVGKISKDARKLVDVTRECLYKGIEQVKPGNRIGDISAAVQAHAEAHGYGVVKEFVGHGIGKALHEEPAVPNVGKAGLGPRLVPGMVLAIEPMVNLGGPEVAVLDDGWTAVTRDGKLSAHWEHTVAVTHDGVEILTASRKS